jgi:MFS family permease
MSGVIGGGGAGVAALLASAAFFITSSMFPGEQFATDGWRYMFFAGGLTSVFSLFIAFAVEESPKFRANVSEQNKGTIQRPIGGIRLLFSPEYKTTLLKNVILAMSASAIYYISSGYLPSFLKLVNGLPNTTASVVLIGASISAISGSVLIGLLSDFIGRRKTFLLVGVSSICLLPACFIALSRSSDMASIWIFSLAITFIGNATYAPLLIFLNERFPTNVRATGTGLSWNFGSSFGGLMPTVVAVSTVGIGDISLTLIILAIILSVIYLFGAFIASEQKNHLS